MAAFDVDLEDINPTFDLVNFLRVRDVPLSSDHLKATYVLGRGFDPCTRDWIGLFNTGWGSTREYISYQWAPLLPSPLTSRSQRRRTVLFPASDVLVSL